MSPSEKRLRELVRLQDRAARRVTKLLIAQAKMFRGVRGGVGPEANP